MGHSRRHLHKPLPHEHPDNVIELGPQARKQKLSKRKTWWNARWPFALVLIAPGIGFAVAWLWHIEPAQSTSLSARSASSTEQYAAQFALCDGPRRTTCVVDGDTFWLNGIKYRVADVNSPEVGEPQCEAEAMLGQKATDRLLFLLNDGGFSLRTIDRDEDTFGRKLRIVTRGGRSLGEVLVAEGLAERWRGSRRNWC